MNAGFTSTGRPLDIEDRIGGSRASWDNPGFPATWTSLFDDMAGGGFDRRWPQLNTNGNGTSAASPGDWRGILIDQYSNDRNVEEVLERRLDLAAPGVNATPSSAQSPGSLASGEKSSDDNLRLGFEIQGYINEANDVDVDTLWACPAPKSGSIDRTAHLLDTVIELIDASGQIIAQFGDNSVSETAAGSPCGTRISRSAASISSRRIRGVSQGRLLNQPQRRWFPCCTARHRWSNGNLPRASPQRPCRSKSPAICSRRTGRRAGRG